MPFNAEQLAYAGKAAIDFYLKNDPIDQINTARPLFEKLVGARKEYAGGLQYVTEQIRESNDSNFGSFFGDSQVSYNRKRTLNQAKYSYGAFHDGFGLNEDELVQNGISMTDDRGAKPSGSEKVQLTNLLSENMETLKLGFQEGFDLQLHRDGTAASTDIAGLDAIVAIDPSADTVGGISSASKTYWQNQVSLNVTIANLIAEMETMWRECIRYGGQAPNFLIAGDVFVNSYRKALLTGGVAGGVVQQVNRSGPGGIELDGGIGSGTKTGLFFKGVEIIWDPVMDVLEAADSPTQEWDSRCYFLNTRYLQLRPIKGHWMVSRRPPRVYDRYVNYWATTARAALTTGKRRAHGVITVTGS